MTDIGGDHRSISLVQFLKPFFREMEGLVIEKISDLASIKTIEKGEVFSQKEGYLFLLKQGLFKAFSIDGKDKEVVLSFYTEGEIVDYWEGNHGSKIGLKALESSVVVQLNLRVLKELGDRELFYSKAYNVLLLHQLKVMQQKILEQSNQKPAERFNYLSKHYPQLVQRLSQKLIAAYLGITQVSLSRIKKRQQVG